MNEIRTLIVDDEPLAREGLLTLLEQDDDVEVVGECSDGREAAESIAGLEPDLVFLDIQMPEMNGFETLETLEEGRLPVVIFVTAYDEFALRAFEVHALDYVLKPFDDDRVRSAVARAKDRLRERRDSAFAERLAKMLEERRSGETATAADGGGRPGETEVRMEAFDDHLRRLVIKKAGRVFFLETRRIDWIEAADYYVRLHVGDDSHLLRATMKHMESSLDPRLFFRIHRSSIVNLKRVRELQPYFNGEYVVVLQDGTKLKLSRSRRKKLEDRLGQKL